MSLKNVQCWRCCGQSHARVLTASSTVSDRPQRMPKGHNKWPVDRTVERADNGQRNRRPSSSLLVSMESHSTHYLVIILVLYVNIRDIATDQKNRKRSFRQRHSHFIAAPLRRILMNIRVNIMLSETKRPRATFFVTLCLHSNFRGWLR